ncbi:ATP-dependent helicase [Carnimonas bestiolae]|uniref:ATP-dependent helicase n=1 Tax=Carnimonas bestiolae TaxID=3402172 RepID=UPI003EDBED85
MTAIEQAPWRVWLTREQLAVVEHPSGHARVSAVAGAGKTSTMVARVLELLARGANPDRMLVLMFNRAAREDFAQRLASTAPHGQRLPQVRTFHSVGMRLCTNLTRKGIIPARRLLDAEWQRERLARQAVSSVRDEFPTLSEQALETEQLDTFCHFCDRVKGELVAPEVMIEQDDFGNESSHFPAAYRRQEQLYAEQGLMSYADLLHLPLKALARNSQLRQQLGGFLDHLIIDEYQDINEAQLRLLSVLAAPHGEVMAVGDANQCIYEWRGAKADAMLERFERYFGAPSDYPLSHTFRHGHALALMANHAIAANQRRHDQLTLAAPDNPHTSLACAQGSRSLVDTLRQWREQGQPLTQAAVLVRSWALTVPVQLALMRANIPFQLGREDRFVFRLPLVRALAGYLEVALTPGLLSSVEHLTLLFSQPATFVSRDRLAALCELLARYQQWPDADAAPLAGLRPFQVRTLRKRWELLNDIASMGSCPAAELLAQVIDGLDAHKVLRKAAARREKGDEDVRLLDVLLDQAQEVGGDTRAFVDLLLKPMEADAEGVSISTVHGAKGLEWPLVLVWGLNEEDFPLYSRDAPLAPAALEEERRLFYVATTRARHQLVMLSDGGERPPSRFIEETDWQSCNTLSGLLYDPDQHDSDAPLKVRRPDIVERYLAQMGAAIKVAAARDASYRWQKGDRLMHDSFGQGEVERVEGEGERCLIEVRFDRAGKRRLLAARAPVAPL